MNDFNNSNENITFFLEEKDDNKNNEEEIQNMIDDFTYLDESDFKKDMNEYLNFLNNDDMPYFVNKSCFGNDEFFYNQEYKVKDLLKICSYYGLDKDIKTSKCKKQDIIETIVYFESLPENYDIVQKRNRMWAYIMELLNDKKMKKFIIWN